MPVHTTVCCELKPEGISVCRKEKKKKIILVLCPGAVLASANLT